MQCKVRDCERESMYQTQQVCQKHYFRHMRTGSYELQVRKPKKVVPDRRGYKRIRALSHPLADGSGYVWAHRFIMYAKYGAKPPPCALCGKHVTWKTLHVDHIDENPANNKAWNLRIACRGCNVKRGRGVECEYEHHTKVKCLGKAMTITEWSRQPNVHVSPGGIRHRLRKGCTAEEALFSKKKTHNRSAA